MARMAWHDALSADSSSRRVAMIGSGRPRYDCVYSTNISPYAANLVRLGYRMEELASGADRVVDAVIAYGGPDEIAAKAQEHLDAGADHVMISPALPGYDRGIEQLEWLAAVLTSTAPLRTAT